MLKLFSLYTFFCKFLFFLSTVNVLFLEYLLITIVNACHYKCWVEFCFGNKIVRWAFNLDDRIFNEFVVWKNLYLFSIYMTWQISYNNTNTCTITQTDIDNHKYIYQYHIGFKMLFLTFALSKALNGADTKVFLERKITWS